MKGCFFICVAVVALGFAAGCRAKASRVAQDNAAFAQASPETRQFWDSAMAAAATNDYATAQTMFYALLGTSLSPEQKVAVSDASTALNDRFLKALRAGDPAAQAALKAMRQHPPNRPTLSWSKP